MTMETKKPKVSTRIQRLSLPKDTTPEFAASAKRIMETVAKISKLCANEGLGADEAYVAIVLTGTFQHEILPENISNGAAKMAEIIYLNCEHIVMN